MKSYRKITKELINSINNIDDEVKQFEHFNKIFADYKKQYIDNATSFFKKENKNFLHTIDTIEKRIKKNILNNTFDDKKLKKQLNGLIATSRKHLKQVDKVEQNQKNILNKSSDVKYRYVLSPSAETHCSVCGGYANKIYNQKQALEINKMLPFHIRCECYLEEIKEEKLKTEQEIKSNRFITKNVIINTNRLKLDLNKRFTQKEIYKALSSLNKTKYDDFVRIVEEQNDLDMYFLIKDVMSKEIDEEKKGE